MSFGENRMSLPGFAASPWPWCSSTSLSPPAYGSGRSSTPFTTLKIAVLAPMPSAIVSTITSAKPGLRRRLRIP